MEDKATKTIAEYLTSAHKKLKTIEERTMMDPGYPVVECRFYRINKETGEIFMHLASYNPGEHTSILRKKEKVNSAEVDTMAPPKNAEFLDGDLMVLIVGNNVFLCTTHAHEKAAERYLKFIFAKAKLEDASTFFSLKKVGNANKLNLIQSQGVKSITIDASIFDASIDCMERKTVSSKLGGSLMDELKSLALKDLGQKEIDQAENLSARIVLTFDSRRKKAVLGRDTLTSMAAKIVSEDDDGFTIETVGGETIRQNQITLRKTVKLAKYGKSVYRNDTWKELRQYYNELNAAGNLSQ